MTVTDRLHLVEQTQERLERTMAAATTVREQAAHVSDLLRRYHI